MTAVGQFRQIDMVARLVSCPLRPGSGQLADHQQLADHLGRSASAISGLMRRSKPGARLQRLCARVVRDPTTTLAFSICQPKCQFDQSYNEHCADDNELSENKVCSLGRADFDYCAPRAYRNVNEVLSADRALARWPGGVLLRRGGQIAVSHDGPSLRIKFSHEQKKVGYLRLGFYSEDVGTI
jgi:hypothetical protein